MKKIKHKLFSKNDKNNFQNPNSDDYVLRFSTTNFLNTNAKSHLPLPSIGLFINKKVFLFMPCLTDQTDILFNETRKLKPYTVRMNIIYSIIEKSGKYW